MTGAEINALIQNVIDRAEISLRDVMEHVVDAQLTNNQTQMTVKIEGALIFHVESMKDVRPKDNTEENADLMFVKPASII